MAGGDKDKDKDKGGSVQARIARIKLATYSMQRLDAVLLGLCLLGVAISYYAYLVETNREKDSYYQPLCDISEHVSCTKAFMSDYGKGFGILPKNSVFSWPNSIYGIIFYTIVAGLSLFNNYRTTVTMLGLAVCSNVFSVYLAGVLIVLQNICIVCVSTYIINAAILVLTVRKIREVKTVSDRSKKKKKTK